MYPNLYFFLKSVFGVEVEVLKLVNTFGLLVAFAFLSAAWALTTELKRRQQAGWLGATTQEIWVGKGAPWSDVVWNAVFGYLIGLKVVGFFLMKEQVLADPQAYLLSGQGSVAAGLLLAAAFGGWRWYQGSKQKMDKPEKRSIRIWPHDRVGDMIILAALFGFGGAKLFHNFENWDELVADPVGALLSFSGLTFYGGLICAGAAIIWYARKHRINLWHLVDSFGPALMLAYAVGRIGCQVAGDGDWGIANSAYVADTQGKAVLATPQQWNDSATVHLNFFKRAQHGVKEVDSTADILHASFKAPAFLPTWMVAYTYPNNVLSEGIGMPDCQGQWCNRLPVPVFPTPFYETIMGLILFGVLWFLRRRLQAPGLLFGVYLVFNGLERFLIEKIRINTTYDLGGFHPSQAELISLALMLLGGLLIWQRRGKQPIQVAKTA
ncbi:MAG: prolipoprotein diacylglyceryl transferase [Chitinophagaceae bacterium]|nr:prolipoprotein diacylglyceryl transferase [Chitinophagaceae bacterium]